MARAWPAPRRRKPFEAAASTGRSQVVVRGDLEAREFIAFWLRDGRVRAGMNVNIWGVTGSIKDLIRSGHPVDADALADPGTSLDDLAAESRHEDPRRQGRAGIYTG